MSDVKFTRSMAEAGFLVLRDQRNQHERFEPALVDLAPIYRAMHNAAPAPSVSDDAPGSGYDIRRLALQSAIQAWDRSGPDVVVLAKTFEAYLRGDAPDKPEHQPTMTDAVKAVAILHEAALGFYKSEKIGRRSGASIGYASGQVDALSDVLTVLTGSRVGRATDVGAGNE